MPSKHCIAFAFKSHKKTAKTPKNCNHHTLHLKTNHKISVKDFVRQLNMGCNPFQNMDENSKSHVHASNIGYNVKLSFVDVNAFGAKVYCDSENRYLIKVENHPTPMYTSLWVRNQGDHYVEKDGTSYIFTSDPKNADKLGNAIPIGHATRDELAWTHESPGMFPSHLNSTSLGKEHHEHNTKFEEKILVHRLKTLNPQKVLYEDAHCNYYTTLETTNREQPFENTLYVHRGMLDLVC